jgi:ATP-dependent Clp protease adaptor protein ClpS
MAIDIQEVTTIDTNQEIKPPVKYKVVIFNDDSTTVEFVVALLVKVFRHNTQTAISITTAIHNEGSGIAGIYTFEIAEQKTLEAVSMARNNNFPLVIKAVPE